MAHFRQFPKGDSRRYMVVLLALDKLGSDASLSEIAEEVGSTRAELYRAIDALGEQFGVKIVKRGTGYEIQGWGVLEKSAAAKFMRSFGR